jgi:hypothetical protein
MALRLQWFESTPAHAAKNQGVTIEIIALKSINFPKYIDQRCTIGALKFQTPPMSEEPSNFSIADDLAPDGETSADADPQLPWPRSGDQVFGPDEDWYNNAFINSAFDGWDLNASGYLQAAQLLVKAIVNTRESPDAVVYPIAFLYRHYLELRLKTIITEGQELLGQRVELRMDHNLDGLLKTARKIIEEVYSKDPKEPVKAVEECMVQFCNLDRQSYAFRYPADKLGNRYLKDLKLLNVRQLGEVMDRISGFLESVSTGIAAYLDDMRSLRAEHWAQNE